MLHLVNKSPFNTTALESAVRFAKKGSPVLLFEDGVYAVQAGTALADRMAGIAGDFDVYVLKEDLQMRGIANIIDGVKEINYPDFVDLVEQHKPASWM